MSHRVHQAAVLFIWKCHRLYSSCGIVLFAAPQNFGDWEAGLHQQRPTSAYRLHLVIRVNGFWNSECHLFSESVRIVLRRFSAAIALEQEGLRFDSSHRHVLPAHMSALWVLRLPLFILMHYWSLLIMILCYTPVRDSSQIWKISIFRIIFKICVVPGMVSHGSIWLRSLHKHLYFLIFGLSL